VVVPPTPTPAAQATRAPSAHSHTVARATCR
jgi:hypothetical protein